MNIRATLVLTGALALAGCEGFKEAMSAHQDVVARAGGQELSATRLGDLIGNSQFPANKDFAKSVAELWVNYQLLGQAAARGDSLVTSKAFDDAVWPIVARAKVSKWGERVSSQLNVPAAAGQGEARYNQGEILAARHILLRANQQPLPDGTPAMSAAEVAAAKSKIDGLRTQVTPANFAQLATANSQDGSARQGGALGLFRRGQMVPEFEQALLALRPGEISPVIRTQFGYHIVYRQPYSEVQEQVAREAGGQARQVAESTYMARLEQGANVQLKGNAAATAKAVAQDVRAHRNDQTVMATTKKGNFTAGRFARWLETIPPQANIPQQLAQAPDSIAGQFVKQMVRSDLLLQQADSAKIVLEPNEMTQLREGFRNLVVSAWNGLGVDPKALADSAKTPAERERLAATRVDAYMERLLTNSAQFVDVPAPLETVLHASARESQLNNAGIERAAQRAAQVRARVDSTRAANQPRSAVPLPGGAPGAGQPQGPPQPQGQPQGRPQPSAPPPAPTTPTPKGRP